jgi:hypothetical protein
MKHYIPQFRQILLTERTIDSSSVRRLNYSAALLSLLLFVGIGAAQAQQPDPLTITKDGKVGVGTATPANKLSVAGAADISGKLSVTGDADFSGTVGIGTSDLGTSKFKIGNSSGDFAHFRFDAVGGGEFEFVGWANGWNINSKTPGKNLYLNRDTNSDVLIGSFGKEMVVRGDSGYVGIGINNPVDASLQIVQSATNAARKDLFQVQHAGNNSFLVSAFGQSHPISPATMQLAAWNGEQNIAIVTDSRQNLLDGGSTKGIFIKSGGNVGIGTTSPGKGKLEISGTASGDKPGFSSLKWLNPGGVNTGGSPNEALSIYASGNIGASAVFVFSDERIKNIRGRSDGARDLETLLGIEITDYEYDDVIGNGRAPHKKVIGQQVEKVFPEAVTKSTDVVPDIYQKATIKDGWVMLATTLKKGDRVRLIGRNQEGLHEVLEISDGRFRTAFAPEGDQVFVYGREVKDFRSVDYDAISMLNVSATQQIKKEKDMEVKALQEENAALRGQLAEQEKRLAAIEARLVSDNQPTVRSASLKTIKQPKQ